MPSGARIRRPTNSWKLMPATRATTSAATMYIELLYAQFERRLEACSRVACGRGWCACRSRGPRECPSPRSPVRCTSRSRIVTARVTYGSATRNSGMCCTTGSSQRSLPSSTSRPSAIAVNAFVVDASVKAVCASTGSLRPRCFVPKPRAYTTWSSLTIATAQTGRVPLLARAFDGGIEAGQRIVARCAQANGTTKAIAATNAAGNDRIMRELLIRVIAPSLDRRSRDRSVTGLAFLFQRRREKI